MSVYPITFQFLDFDHKGGTKAYHMIKAENALGNSIVVYRWGKVGSFGDIKVEAYTRSVDASKALTKKINSRLDGGYRVTNEADKTANSDVELKSSFGSIMWLKIGADAISHLNPNLNVSGLKEAAPVAYDEQGYKVDNARRVDAATVARNVQDQIDREKAAETDQLKDLPTYGLF